MEHIADKEEEFVVSVGELCELHYKSDKYDTIVLDIAKTTLVEPSKLDTSYIFNVDTSLFEPHHNYNCNLIGFFDDDSWEYIKSFHIVTRDRVIMFP